MATRLPSVRFERGLRITLPDPWYPNTDRILVMYCLIGRLEDGTPFLLEYDRGMAGWWCGVRLGESLRRKILHRLRTEIRSASTPPDYLEYLDFSKEGHKAAESVRRDFFERVWKQETLGEREEEYVDLKVPFAEKDQAKALGARWDAIRRTWRVRRQDDMSAFTRWLPSC